MQVNYDGYYARSTVHLITLGEPYMLCDSDESRVAITFTTNDGTNVYIGPSPAITIDSGWTFALDSKGNQTREISNSFHGRAATIAWYAYHPAATPHVGCTEYFGGKGPLIVKIQEKPKCPPRQLVK